MARKVLLSFLGTNDYFPVYYTWGEKKKKTTPHRTKFVQEAIASKLCKDSWGKDDCIMVFRTKESDAANWQDTDKGKGLKSVLAAVPGVKCRINPEDQPGTDSYMIPLGFSEQEMWDIFKCVFDKLLPEDEIYFDVTHAFRTIPMFASVLFNYARFLKHTHVKGIYYGAFEILGPLYKVKALPIEEQERLTVPIVDLTNIVRLQEINTAASNFENFGNLSSFSDILYDTGISELDNAVNDTSIALDELDFFIQTCRIDDIKQGRFMQTITENITIFCESPFTNDAQRTLIKKILTQLEQFGFKPYNTYENVEAAANWAITHNMIQQAYTMAKEYIISRVVDMLRKAGLEDELKKELIEKDGDKGNITYKIREAIGSILSAGKYESRGRIVLRGRRWKDSPAANRIVNANRQLYLLTAPYRTITERRNHLNHAASSDSDNYTYDEYREEFLTPWEKCLSILNEGVSK